MKITPRSKATLTEIAILATSAVVAGTLARELADHDVSVAAIISVILAVLACGLYVGTQIGQGLRVTVYTCTAKGCPVTIRAKDVDSDELTRLKAYATDHTQHGSTR